MPWYRIVITHRASGKALMDAFEEVYMAELPTAPPADASVYHCEISADDHVYYFSPGASNLVPELLQQRNAIAYAEEPDLSHFTKVNI